MTANIITASGTATEICEKLRALRAIFPKGATLADVAKVASFATLTTVTRQQMEEIERRHKKQ